MAKNKSKKAAKGSNSNNGGSSQPNVKGTRARKRATRNRKPTIPTELIHAVCSNTDPFCEHALNAKVYDTNSNRSLTFQSRDLITVTTSASGEAFIILTQNPFKAYAPAATFAAGAVATWPGAYTVNSFYNQYNSTGGSWRVVSWGYKYYTTQAWTSAIGSVIITEIGGLDPSLITGQVVASLVNGSKAKVSALRDAVMTFIGRPSGEASNMYVTGFGTSDFNDWTLSYLAITGATASTVVGSIELVVNYEWLPRSASGLGPIATAAAPNIPVVNQLRANAYSVMDTIQTVKDVGETSYSVLKTIKDVAETAVAIGSNPYARAAAGMLMM